MFIINLLVSYGNTQPSGKPWRWSKKASNHLDCRAGYYHSSLPAVAFTHPRLPLRDWPAACHGCLGRPPAPGPCARAAPRKAQPLAGLPPAWPSWTLYQDIFRCACVAPPKRPVTWGTYAICLFYRVLQALVAWVLAQLPVIERVGGGAPKSM